MSDTTPSPSEHAQAWLTGFDHALQRRDIDAAVAMMGDDCYWRDLVSFTWNICTQESPAAVRAMLAARLDDVAPSHWQLTGDATTAEAFHDTSRGITWLRDADALADAYGLAPTMSYAAATAASRTRRLSAKARG